MHLDPTTLFLIWFGGGFVILLAWSALVGQALMGDQLRTFRPAVGALALVGVFHPAAAVGAVDLVRLGRHLATAPTDDASASQHDDLRRQRAAELVLSGWAARAIYACAAASAVVAVAAFISAGGLP